MLDLILKEIKIKETKACSITYRNYCMTHEMIHSKGINLFDCIRCFDKNSTDENDLIPKLTYSNLKISIEGK